MTDLIYETPNKMFLIYANSDPQWQELFGQDANWFSIVKIIEQGDIGVFTLPVQQAFSLKEAFKWLFQNNIISKDELIFQIKEKCRPVTQ